MIWTIEYVDHYHEEDHVMANPLQRLDPGWRWEALSVYNAERARGIVHTAAYQERMLAEQAAYDAELSERHRAEGWIELPRDMSSVMTWVKS